MARTYYDILGVKPDATSEELQSARARRAQVIEPSRLVHRSKEEQTLAGELLRRLDQAFSVLEDEGSRELYDSCLESGEDFASRQAEARPELEDERQVRERVEAEYAEAVGLLVARLERYVRALDPARGWHPEPQEGPWDLVLASAGGARPCRLHLKVLAELHPGDLVATIETAEANLARAQGPTTHAYLLAAGLLLEGGRLYTTAEGFHRGSWHAADPAGPRAFLAYTDLDGSLPVIAGVEDPDPDLAQLTMVEEVEVAVDAAPPAPPAPTTSPPEGGDEPTPEDFPVLVVDDDRLPFEVVRRALSGGPYQLDHATDWPDFRELLRARSYAVIVLDIQLPSLSGDKLALYVNSNDEIHPKPRIVIHSGLESTVLRRVAAMVGAQACLAKGCGAEAIQAAVRDGAKAYMRDKLLTGPW